MYKFTALLITVLLLGFSAVQAQDFRSIVQPNIVITGDEGGQPVEVEPYEFGPISYNSVYSLGDLTWTVNNISDLASRGGSGYDLQSNGSTQEVWYDLNIPGYVHAAFTWSSVCDNAWTDRTVLYFGSDNGGANWFELGAVPVNNGSTGRGGFPSIIGTSTGSAVLANHNNNAPHPVRGTVFIDNSFFEYNFTEFDPGILPNNQGNAIWPMLAINDNDEIVMAASISGGDSFYINTLRNGVWGGWQIFNGDQAETHSLNFSEGGKVGLAWIGGTGQDGNVYYAESNDAGSTWSSPITVFTAIPDPSVPGDIYGPIRGVNVNFYGEQPCVVFEAGWQTTTGNYYPGREADIRFWSPLINEGEPKVIADSNNVSYFFNYGVADVMWHLGRPVIGRSQLHDYLLVAFQATTGEYWPGASAADSTAFFCGMFMYSSDGGETWSVPEQFTPPSTPTLDFRHVSIVPVAPAEPNKIIVNLVMQGDPMPASTPNGWNIMPPSITAKYYHFTSEIAIVGVDDEIVANNFNLEQNYPNPFNPSTTINYTLAERSAVTLKVYDVLGNEVANLVNTTQEAGKHSIDFNAGGLASGLYIYTLNTGNFTSSKKMMFLK